MSSQNKPDSNVLSSIYDDKLSSTVLGSYSVQRLTIYGVIVGLIFPAFAWFFDFLINDFNFSFQAIAKIHSQNPLHFIIDLAPVILGIMAYYISRRYDSRRNYLRHIIQERNKLIHKNAELAQSIGAGDFDVETAHIEESDRLGISLLKMLNSLQETSKKETKQNWIAKGKEIISRVLNQQNNIEDLAYNTLVELIKYTNTIQGAFYSFDEDKELLINIASYAYQRKKYINQEFKIGQGLIGQAAYEKDIIYRSELPEDYITISSGIIGDAKPGSILIVPLISDEKLQGVIELASLYKTIDDKSIQLIKEQSNIIAQTLFNLKVNVRTENLLSESQKLTQKLTKNEDVLRQNAKQMKQTQLELTRSNRKMENQVEEIKKGQERTYALLENASEVITIYDTEGIVQYVSPSVHNILGYEPEEMLGTNRFERGESVLKDAFNELIKNPDIEKTFEYRYEKKNHGLVWLETTGRNLIDNQAINGIIFNTRDITVRKIAEEAQRMSGEMQALSENSPDMIIRLNTEGKFFYANPIVEKITGISRAKLKQKRITEVNFQQEFVAFLSKGIEEIKESKRKYQVEESLPTIDGNRIMQVNVIPEFNKNHDVETILFVAHDITERKEIELEIEKKNKAITESINYAQRIQSAIIPDIKIIKEYIPNSFIFYKPRDVVSGDFPWFFVSGDDIYIAAVDCTGHGVPGALLSFIGYFLLNSIVDHDKSINAGEVLDLLHSGVRRTLRQEEDDASARDGMDIALVKLNYKRKEIQFAGAHRPLYYLSSGNLEQFKGNSKAIGGIPPRRKEEENFKNFTLNYKPGDRIFFFSDGLPDQIGGVSGRKYQARRIRETVVKYKDHPIEDVGKFFIEDFKEWKGDNKQIDDVLLMGIEF